MIHHYLKLWLCCKLGSNLFFKFSCFCGGKADFLVCTLALHVVIYNLFTSKIVFPQKIYWAEVNKTGEYYIFLHNFFTTGYPPFGVLKIGQCVGNANNKTSKNSGQHHCGMIFPSFEPLKNGTQREGSAMLTVRFKKKSSGCFLAMGRRIMEFDGAASFRAKLLFCY